MDDNNHYFPYYKDNIIGPPLCFIEAIRFCIEHAILNKNIQYENEISFFKFGVNCYKGFFDRKFYSKYSIKIC